MRPGAVIGVAVPLITFVLMTAVGSDLRPDDFRRLLQRSRLVWAGLLVPPLVLPALAVGLIAVARPPAPVATGLLLIAACPVGGISNTFTYLARGSTALSVTLTALSCLLAVATVPATGAVFGHALQRPFAARVPLPALLGQLCVTVALPIAGGMLLRSTWPAVAERHRPTMQRAAFVLLGLLLALIVLADVPGFVSTLPHAVPLAAAFIAASFLVGRGVGRALGADTADRIAIAIEFATRNVAIATTIAVSVLGRVDFATFGTAYFLTELPLMTAAAVLLRPAAAGAAPDGRASSSLE